MNNQTSPTAHAAVVLPRTLFDHPDRNALEETIEALGAKVVWLAEQGADGLSRIQCSLYDSKIKPNDALVVIDNHDDLRSAATIYGLACIGIVLGTDYSLMPDMAAMGKKVMFGVDALVTHLRP